MKILPMKTLNFTFTKDIVNCNNEALVQNPLRATLAVANLTEAAAARVYSTVLSHV